MAGDVSLIEEMRRREEQRRREAKGAGTAERPAGDWLDRGAHDGTAAPEGDEDFPAYGFHRGVQDRALHLQVQLRQGPWPPAFGYAWLIGPAWEPSGDGRGRGQAIVLHYATGHQVTIRGRNLWPLLVMILRHRAYRVTEQGEEHDRFAAEGETVVYAIEVAEPNGATE